MTLILNRPTPEGRALGTELVRLIEPLVQQFVRDGGHDSRCASCAFRLGTVPNGCGPSLLDALKCVMEGEPFYCHMEDRPCHGWVVATVPRSIP